MKYKTPLIILSILIIIALGAYKLWSNSQFRVTSITPSTSGKIATSTSVIKIEFSHDLADDTNYDRTVISDGQSIVNEVERRGKSLYIRLFELMEGSSYKIGFKEITSTSGKSINNFTLNFKATYIPYHKLSQAQKDLQAGETDRFEVEDPILDHLPYSTLNYALEPINEMDEEGAYVLNINLKIFLNNADRGYEEETTELYKEQAFEYLRSKGINPEDYNFNYIVQQPAY